MAFVNLRYNSDAPFCAYVYYHGEKVETEVHNLPYCTHHIAQ